VTRALLSDVGRLGCDTAPLIYLMERHPDFGPPVVDVARRVDEGAVVLVASTITLTELLIRPLRLGRIDLVAAYRALLEHHRHVELVDIDAEVAVRAAELRARHRLRTPDALQIAAAIHAGCDAFLTNDRDLARVDEIAVVLVADLVARNGP
jgi:predicted nucleic acid-binding protein